METMVRKKVICVFGYDFYYFQNSGSSNDDFFPLAFKTLLRQSRVIKISKNAFYVALIHR